MTADLSLPETPKQIFEELTAQKISVDVLVNNAGFGAHGAFAELPLQRQLEMIQVNITALTELTGLFLPGMIQRRRGGILNVGSVAGFVPGPDMAVYYATKAFVLSFTEALAEELARHRLDRFRFMSRPDGNAILATSRAGKKCGRSKRSKMSAEAVAIYGHRAFRNGKVTAVPGLQNKIFVFLNRIFPRSLPRKIVKFYNRTTD